MQEVFIDCTYFEPHKQCLVFIFCTFYRFSCFPIALDASIGECDQNLFYNFHWPKYVLSPFIISDYNEYIIKSTRLSSKFTEKKQKYAESLIYRVRIVGKFLCSVIAIAWVCFCAFLYYWRSFSVLYFTF